MDGSADDAKAFVQEYIGNSFYNFHFFDIQKSFNVQSTKREDLNDLFREFITDYAEKMQVADNLDLFEEDTGRYIEDAEKKKKSQDEIESKKAEIERARTLVKQIPYPKTVFYTGEQTQIIELSIRELSAQKEALRNCGYQVALGALEKLVNNEALKREYAVIQEIAAYWQNKAALILQAVNAGFHKNTDAIAVLEAKIVQLDRLSLSRNTILQDGERVASLQSPDFTLVDFNTAKTAIGGKENAVLKLQQELETYCRTNEELDKQIEEYRQLQERASTRATEIRRIVAELSKEEYDNVGPALSKFYDKLARFNANGEFKIVPEKEGISLVDEKGKNVVNILSNGQISIFILAYFFAGINARNDREKMKVFFIDDLTACMDDVNMLGFMDLLKYQLSSKETVDQLFFITCDDRISKLLKYKLSGRGIELCELLEAVFV